MFGYVKAPEIITPSVQLVPRITYISREDNLDYPAPLAYKWSYVFNSAVYFRVAQRWPISALPTSQ